MSSSKLHLDIIVITLTETMQCDTKDHSCKTSGTLIPVTAIIIPRWWGDHDCHLSPLNICQLFTLGMRAHTGTCWPSEGQSTTESWVSVWGYLLHAFVTGLYAAAVLCLQQLYRVRELYAATVDTHPGLRWASEEGWMDLHYQVNFLSVYLY